MKKLVLIRHGQSTWNKENRFTGWTDVPLSEQGVAEAKKAGKLLKEKGFRFKMAYTSYLSRAIKTLWLVLEEMDQMYIPVLKDWRLNEKHYGELQGLNKAETAEKYGDEQVLLWRRSFDVPPKPLEDNDPRNPAADPRFADVNPKDLPATESLKEVIERMIPYWDNDIKASLSQHNEILVAAHGNSLRALVMHLKEMSEEAIIAFNIPTGIPYVFEFDNEMNLVKDYFIGDPEEIKKLMDQVANQAKGK
ncbi:MAG: 2,3-diphosphoglycerate-dependent phosphoglycerate mutase [Bacteroidetes bacterium]|nr:2,3-diphosphoglycerate-dependent phosphoglycerate mutase [Bacteroidota bacterium]MBU1579321.1 2,3-diphosphoglycerate-dependent phosphoglycerate mutase [Bacteroidota bacterium]MBU2466070.1 2,3-diphosphoglycerate-dependent phosphoglycerate mutase [Bacteroidota bacterium]MBU2556285.1 2,3-diphosphoglycerate-dependent phosphoglycerate mutase [Bacteroidota bacterium]